MVMMMLLLLQQHHHHHHHPEGVACGMVTISRSFTDTS
jgi:hypothetical protein